MGIHYTVDTTARDRLNYSILSECGKEKFWYKFKERNITTRDLLELYVRGLDIVNFEHLIDLDIRCGHF